MSDPIAAAQPVQTDDGGRQGELTLLRRFPRVGILAWSFVGLVLAIAIVLAALAAVSEIVLPMLFAAVLAVMFKPLAGALQRRGLKPSLAAGLVVLGLLAVGVGVFVATARGVADQVDEISASADQAVSKAAEHTDELGLDRPALDDVRAAVADADPLVTTGFLTGFVDGLSTLVGIASGVILGALIMYYLLKDGTRLRRSAVEQMHPTYQPEIDDFVGSACGILRDYGRGRSVMSAIVSLVVGGAALLMGLPLLFTIVVVNFVGGYIPYIGAFLGGGLAVVIATGEGGLPLGALMLLVVLAANLALENLVEPRVMGRTLDIHPLAVLVVTALGGLVGGIVGLILAVPAWVIAGEAIQRLRSGGVVERAAAMAQPTAKALLD